MNKNRIIYERVTVLDDILEIAIPKMFNRVFFQGDDKNKQSYVAWANNKNEAIYISIRTKPVPIKGDNGSCKVANGCRKE